jgi:hypothetical protein
VSSKDVKGSGNMKRREVITFLAGFGATLPALAARGQAPTKPSLIGVLVSGSKEATQPRLSGFPQGMRELGYIQGQNYIIEARYGDGADGVAELAVSTDPAHGVPPTLITARRPTRCGTGACGSESLVPDRSSLQ